MEPIINMRYICIYIHISCIIEELTSVRRELCIIKGHVMLGVGVIATAVDAFSASKGGWLYKTIQNTSHSRVDHVNS